jgi:hypothetical protein
LDGTTLLVSRGRGRYVCDALVEFDPSSGRLSGVKAGKIMNDWATFWDFAGIKMVSKRVNAQKAASFAD